MGMEKIQNQDELVKKIEYLKVARRVIVFTNGCFDIIHPGHVTYLEKAKKLGDILVLGVNSDVSVKKIKGNNRPILNESERTIILSRLEMVDFVCLFNDDTPYRLIAAIKPDVLVKGGDWAVNNIVGKDIVEKHGGKVVNIPYIEGSSTTNIIERIIKSYGVKS
jgi:rfaE bifunctional protein nucleotidyltransferase chain/domain